jgi:hypothetical protein
MEKNQNGNNQGNNLPVNAGQPGTPEKKGLKAFIDGLHRKYDAVRYSKAGKWVARGLTALAIAGTGKACYDKGIAKGKASVVPTVVTVEPIPAEETTEAPAEEKSEVETAE